MSLYHLHNLNWHEPRLVRPVIDLPNTYRDKTTTMTSELKECCVTGHIHSGHPQGSEMTMGSLSTYIAKPENETSSGSAAIVIISDIFGYRLPNTRLVADEYAKNGFVTYIPDLLDNNAMDIKHLKTLAPWPEQKADQTMLGKVGATASVGLDMAPWLYRHRSAVVLPKLQLFLKGVKASHSKLYTLGYCWGSQYAFMSADPNSELSEGVDAAAACHPSMVNADVVAKATKPITVAAGEIDELFDWKKMEAVIKKNGGEVVVYPKMVHGFSIRGDLKRPDVHQAKEDALMQVVNFFRAH